MSTNKLHFIFAHQQARQLAAKACLESPDGFHCRITPPTRSLDQSAKFHAMCADIARQKPFAGKLRSPETWKMLLISGHAIATKQGVEMMPGLEGEFLNLRDSSAQMSITRMNSLIEYALAYCANEGVRLSEA